MIPTIFIVDDDAPIRDGLAQLLATHYYSVQSFAKAEDFLAQCNPGISGCLLLDLRLPGISGTELQHELEKRGIKLPIIFLTAYGDIPTSVHTLKHGAMDFLEKPISAQTLLEHVQAALALNEQHQRDRSVRELAQSRLAKLTPREREVMRLAAAGQASKEIARALGISHRTVEVHRARIMQKTGVENLVELADLARDGGAESKVRSEPPAGEPT